jgi:peptide chain release factor 3
MQAGEQTPLFFGSAMTNFGVEIFLKRFLQLAQSPPGRMAMVVRRGGAASQGQRSVPEEDSLTDYSVEGVGSGTPAAELTTPDEGMRPLASSVASKECLVPPSDAEFSGFVFKLQANLDPRHRDRMAFVRICSGVFRKGMKVQHSRTERSLSLASAQNLFAQDREEVTVAYPGDVIGIHNPGVFAIGDTIYTGGGRVAFPGIPSFSPEKFAYIRNPNPSTYKKFQKVKQSSTTPEILGQVCDVLQTAYQGMCDCIAKFCTQGLKELLDEGAVQMLRDRSDDGSGSPLLAAVGQLQFEVSEGVRIDQCRRRPSVCAS